MKKLTLIRHAKSSWEFDVSDRERPLQKRGVVDAALVSKEFKTSLLDLDKVFSSPANRALSTCKIFMQNLQANEDLVEVSEDLYDFGGQLVIKFLKNLNDNYNNVVIFGHNHAFTSIVNLLGDEYIENLPTSGLVSISFNIKSWKDINKGKTELVIFPKHLK